jgi:hypothetical protein
VLDCIFYFYILCTSTVIHDDWFPGLDSNETRPACKLQVWLLKPSGLPLSVCLSVCLSWQRGLHGVWTRSSSVRNSLRSSMYRHCAHRDIATCHRLSCCTQWTGVRSSAVVLPLFCSVLWQHFIESGELSKFWQRRHWDNGLLAEWRSTFSWAAQYCPICDTNDSLLCPVGLECQLDVEQQTLVTAGQFPSV